MWRFTRKNRGLRSELPAAEGGKLRRWEKVEKTIRSEEHANRHSINARERRSALLNEKKRPESCANLADGGQSGAD